MSPFLGLVIVPTVATVYILVEGVALTSISLVSNSLIKAAPHCWT